MKDQFMCRHGDQLSLYAIVCMSHEVLFLVEKVVVLGRFLKEEDVKMDEIVIASSVMSTLALAFSRLIEAMEDVCPAVATRAILLLKTIKTSSLKVLY